jgi:hypothetical protein
MRNMHQTLVSYGSVKNLPAGDPYPGGPVALLKLDPEYKTLPKCPSGGTYTFGSKVGYLINLRDDIRCSHAEDLSHVWSRD